MWRFAPFSGRWRARNSDSLEQNCATGEAQPEHDAFDPVASYHPSERKGNPQAETVKTVEQLSEEAPSRELS